MFDEILWLIGKNGSGRSTILRIIAGIYKQDKGDIRFNSKVVSSINLTVDLKYYLTMLDNIFLVGSLFGLSKARIKKRFNLMVEFSELENFVDTKLYQFFQGMFHRLAFSIAVHSDPEILLFDEVFKKGKIIDEGSIEKVILKYKNIESEI